ncbi:MAG: glycosyltransferase [Syntrophales bacterium]|jgi:glycosyltransferase involved in cell wall biosynthesis|nr:glycosyltransferase [Syntrophales bacterium]MDY0043512.1 glycosyltransferase [Syntrophales bacterium]
MVSIIISFYERLDYLRCCLDSLRLCRGNFDEVIIADDGSGTETVNRLQDLIPAYEFPITHVWQPKNGFRLALARNNGIRKAAGEYLIFLDCDFLVLPGTIECHVKAAKPGKFIAGLCKYTTQEQAKRILHEEISKELLENLYHELPEKPVTREHFNFIKYGILMRFRAVNPRKQKCSSHFSVHRKDMEFVNGYDENFIGWGGEDEDLALRFIKAGFRGRSIIPSAKVLHLWHPKELGNRHWREGANIEYLNRENIPFFCKKGLRK